MRNSNTNLGVPALPLPTWAGADVFVIGGGSSLVNFDWPVLRGHSTVGCNYAFRLGVGLCNVCVFGDVGFLESNFVGLEVFAKRAPVVTVDRSGIRRAATSNNLDWLYRFRFAEQGLPTDGSLGWNASTGALAIHLALFLGAAKVYLLGFDLVPMIGNANWHDSGKIHREPPNVVFSRHRKGLEYLSSHYQDSYPDSEVIQVVSPGVPPLGFFKTCGRDEMFGKESTIATNYA